MDVSTRTVSMSWLDARKSTAISTSDWLIGRPSTTPSAVPRCRRHDPCPSRGRTRGPPAGPHPTARARRSSTADSRSQSLTFAGQRDLRYQRALIAGQPQFHEPVGASKRRRFVKALVEIGRRHASPPALYAVRSTSSAAVPLISRQAWSMFMWSPCSLARCRVEPPQSLTYRTDESLG